MMTGFVGSASFRLAKPVSTEARKLFGGLSSMAFYSGVGHRTTMGMGQCMVVREGETQPNESLTGLVAESSVPTV